MGDARDSLDAENGGKQGGILPGRRGKEMCGKSGTFYQMQSTFEPQPPIPRGYMGPSYAMSEPEAALAFE